MLAHEDGILLGISQAPSRPVRASAVSQLLRALQDEPGLPARTREGDRAFSIHMANTRSLRERAYRLARDVYAKKGYASGEENLAQPFDLRADIGMLLATASGGQAAATVTCIPDSPEGLPCDEVFGGCLDELRHAGRRLTEVTRFVLAEEFQHERKLLVQVINTVSIFARRLAHADDFVIEVNPRHVAFYRRMMKFEVLAPERPCPRVNGAPAVLLRLDLHQQAEWIKKHAGPGAQRDGSGRSLYVHFMPYDAEEDVARDLEAQSQAMSALDAVHFGLVQICKSA